MHDGDLDEHNAMPPIDMLAAWFAAQGWPCERVSEDEVVASAPGAWGSYELRGVWRAEDAVLQLLAFPDLRVADHQNVPIHETLALINEQLWLGHFECWSSNGTILFRHAVLLGSDATISPETADVIVETAVDELDRFYPVFQFVLWGGKSPKDALAAAMVETRGEA